VSEQSVSQRCLQAVVPASEAVSARGAALSTPQPAIGPMTVSRYHPMLVVLVEMTPCCGHAKGSVSEQV